MISCFTTDEGEPRLYITRSASVQSYFTPADDGQSAVLHLVPGFCCDDASFARTVNAVEKCVIAEVARRLDIAEDDVLRQPFATLRRVADAPLPAWYRYAARPKSRTPNRVR